MMRRPRLSIAPIDRRVRRSRMPISPPTLEYRRRYEAKGLEIERLKR